MSPHEFHHNDTSTLFLLHKHFKTSALNSQFWFRPVAVHSYYMDLRQTLAKSAEGADLLRRFHKLNVCQNLDHDQLGVVKPVLEKTLSCQTLLYKGQHRLGVWYELSRKLQAWLVSGWRVRLGLNREMNKSFFLINGRVQGSVSEWILRAEARGFDPIVKPPIRAGQPCHWPRQRIHVSLTRIEKNRYVMRKEQKSCWLKQ